ncbi:hypothetical protein AJ80_00431 [Polytolypa hystricis UAMH7299]|uniref:Fumarylacetoacetase-like C-terminal domain-containing protein n=1 Tax=Polytolypa hystricis (strain UAMH7299) TaxID=1447883 RepID=A0A2B7Z3E5_POLH7|nr:hypothetical protein AJ80_00431 [Polytolypa hystricis UAMH7299]
MASYERLIRFEDSTGKAQFGEPLISSDETSSLDEIVACGALEARCLNGSDIFSLSPSTETAKVKKVLGLLSPNDVPIVKCSRREAGPLRPTHPYSSNLEPSVASYNEDIPIPKLAQEDQLDYEGELSIVIGKTGKDIPQSEALDYVAGFVPANDVSARKSQRDPKFAGGVPQWCFSKGFDKFAPLGLMLVSPKVVGNAGNLRLQTIVNGEVRQDTSTSDLLFNTQAIISFIIQGTTLETGTVIMTGTPSGVAMGMKEPLWLKDGDVVEVKIEALGSVKNRMVFQ